MNPFIENKKELTQNSFISKVLFNQMKKYEIRNDEIIKSCTHQDENGNSTIERVDQDPGSGKTEYQCNLCLRYV